jgi:hypothetical protein
MPRPPIRAAERVKGVHVNLHPSTWEALRRLAFEQRTTVSAQVRWGVEEYLARRNRPASPRRVFSAISSRRKKDGKP